ncbi:MAG TPA: COX15/CtaA family protein, partial [Bdellovibrionota bacterium]|nr:COX15/CtaA family protein [Bdellovibrionota bacterium]
MKAALTAKMSPATARAVLRWLYILCGLILGIVTVGGITRLTQSGLSMVDWRLFMDMLPPLTHDDWLRTFAKYQQYPQYLKENAGMTLEQFKFIFFWEYIHRMYGRVIGLFYMFPLIYWAVRRELNRPLGLRLAGGFGFVCLQGFVGWFMVKSGLVNEPRVSHFRLATHLGLALALLAYHAWLALDLREALGLAKAPKKKTLWTADLLWIGRILLAVVCLQILWGAFTAGLRAGWGYNTFPTMDGQWIPDAIGRE